MNSDISKVRELLADQVENLSGFINENRADLLRLKKGDIFEGASEMESSLKVSPVISRLNEAIEAYNEKHRGPLAKKFREIRDNSEIGISTVLADAYDHFIACDLPEIDIALQTRFFKTAKGAFISDLKETMNKTLVVLEVARQIPQLSSDIDDLSAHFSAA